MPRPTVRVVSRSYVPEDEAERRRREAEQLMGPDLEAIPAIDAPPPPGTPPAPPPGTSTGLPSLQELLGQRPLTEQAPPELREEAAAAQAVGERYRAAGAPVPPGGVRSTGGTYHPPRRPAEPEPETTQPDPVVSQAPAPRQPAAPERTAAAPPSRSLAAPAAPPPEFIDPGPGQEVSAPANPGTPSASPIADQVRELLRQRQEARAAAPQRQDYTGADVADAILTPIRAIGRGLLAMGTRGSVQAPIRSFGREARARDQAAMEAYQEAQRQGQAGDLALARLGIQAQSADERNALMRQREERQTRLADLGLELDRERLRSQVDLRRAQAAAASGRTEMLEALRDPASEVSEQARQRYLRTVGMLTSVTGDDFATDVEGLSAADIAAMEAVLPRIRDVRRRGRRAGAGGGGGQRRAESRAAVERAARRAGMSDEEIAAFGSSRRDLEQLRREAIQRSRRQSRAGREAGTVIPGWEQSGESVGLTAPEVRTLRNANAQARILQGQIRTMESLVDEVSRLEAAGAEAGVVSAAMGRARAAHEQVINALREVGNYGVPQEAELVRMERLAPRLGSVQGMISSRNIYAGLASSMRQRMNDYMGAYNFRRSQSAPQRRQGAPAGGPEGNRVRVQHPDGRTGTIPRSQLEAARAAGFTEVSGGS